MSITDIIAVVCAHPEDALDRDIFDLALGRIVREMLAMKKSAIVRDAPRGRPPHANTLTPRIMRARLDRHIDDADRAGLSARGVAELRRIIDEEFLWGVRDARVRLGEINDVLRSGW